MELHFAASSGSVALNADEDVFSRSPIEIKHRQARGHAPTRWEFKGGREAQVKVSSMLDREHHTERRIWPQ